MSAFTPHPSPEAIRADIAPTDSAPEFIEDDLNPRIFRSYPISAYVDYLRGRGPYPGLAAALELIKRAGVD